MIVIRDAKAEEAEAICEVLRRSIIELCGPDHSNDPLLLNPWLSNKTAENIQKWISFLDNSFLVATYEEIITAVGSVSDQGVINLNYIAPAFRFEGISRALLHALEARALERGARGYALVSTETAHRFYQNAGYHDDPTIERAPGMKGGYSMRKSISD